MGKHGVDKMCSRIIHSASDARRTETATFARKSDKFLMTTVLAPGSDEAVIENPTFEVSVDFFLHKRG
jgi:hypothetical protein